MNRNKVFRGILLILASVVALGVVGEIAVRYRDAHRDSAPGSMPSIFYKHSRLGHALVRDSEYYGWVHVNSHGFRGPEISVENAPGSKRIMAVGASTTFDAWAGHDEDAWPARLQHWASEIVGEGRVEVINAGVPGYTVHDNLVRLQSELYSFRPDVIILYQAHNDLFRAFQRVIEQREPDANRPNEQDTATPWGYWLSQNSILYNKLVARWKAVRMKLRFERNQEERTPSPAEWTAAIEEGAQDFERDVRSFVLIAHGMGIPVVLVGVLSVWDEERAYVPVEQLVRGYERYDRVLRKVAAECGAVYVSSAEFGMVGDEWFAYRDPIHFSTKGADSFASRLAQSLLQTGVLSAPKVTGKGATPKTSAGASEPVSRSAPATSRSAAAPCGGIKCFGADPS